MSIMDIDPSYEYLSQASSSLSKSGTNTLQLTAYTYAYSSVDSIGAHFIIERWTGSAWVSAVSNNGISVNTSFYGDTKSFSLTPGYYYRGKTVHWVRKGSAYEEHTKYTSNYLL